MRRNVLLGLLLLSDGAVACQCSPESVEEALRRNTEFIFFAHIDSARTVEDAEGPWLVLDLSEVLPLEPGRIPDGKIKTHADSGMCGSTVAVPEYYWFFTDGNGVSTRCSATRPAHDRSTNVLFIKIHERLIDMKRLGRDLAPKK